MVSFGFPKNERLSRRTLWELVFEEGKQLKAYPLLLYYLKTPLPEPVAAQAGFAVPKRAFRKAVARNRIRRLMREAYRLEKQVVFNNSFGPYAFVFLYLGKEMPDFQQISGAMKTLLKKIVTHEEANEA